MTDQDKPDSPKKKIVKTSLLRILIGVAIAAVLLRGVLELDQRLAYAPYHKDYIPSWSHDGKTIVYVQWRPWKNGTVNAFQIWRMETDGRNRKMIYEAPEGYGAYGIRRLNFSSDDTFLNLRLNREIHRTGEMKDLLVKVPLDTGKKPEQWELDKKFPFDIFLAFKDDLVILRRMRAPGTWAKSDVYEMRFSDRKILRTIPFPSGKEVCYVMEYYGKECDPIGQLNCLVGENARDCQTRLFDVGKNVSFPLANDLSEVLYLEKSGTYLVYGTGDANRMCFIDKEGKITASTPLPGKPRDPRSVKVCPDESTVAIADPQNFSCIEIGTLKKTVIALPVAITSGLAISPDSKQMAFSDGDIIYRVDLDGKNLLPLTELSPRSRLMKSKLFLKYEDFRNKIIFGHH